MAAPRSSTLLIVLSYVGCVSLGLPDGLLGTALHELLPRAARADGAQPIG